MQRMKKIIIFLSILLSATLVNAQIKRTPVKSAAKTDSAAASQPVQNTEQRQNRKAALKELNLTKEQKIKMKELRDDMKAKEDSINSDSKLTDDEKKVKLHQLRKQKLQTIEGMLTDEQKAKFRELRNKKQQEEMQ